LHFRAKPGALFTAEDYGLDNVELWPEHWPAWGLYLEMAGQWRRAGMSGTPVALDYGPLFARMERMRLADDDWEDLFDDVRVLERAALDQMQDNEK
jgi:hypothetical protein